MKVLKASVLAVMVLFLVASVSYGQTVNKDYIKGIDYATQGEFQKAAEEFKKVPENDPLFPGAELCLKHIEYALGKGVENGAIINLFKGIVYFQIKKYDEAITEFKKAIAVDPDFARAYVVLGSAYDAKGMPAEATAMWKNAVGVDPNDSWAYINLGTMYLNKKLFDEAIAEFKQAVAVDPHFASAYFSLGTAYVYKGMHDEAIAELKKALALDPHLVQTYATIAVAYFHKKHYDVALEYCNKAKEHGVKIPATFLQTLTSYLERQYNDPKGYFTIVAPEGWRIEEYRQDPRGKIAFYAPGEQADLRVLAKAVNISDYDGLMKDVESIEKQLNVTMNIEPFVFNSLQAIKRQFSMPMQGKIAKVLMIDVLVDGISHNLQYSGDPATFDKYYQTAWQSMVTYQPLERAMPPVPQEARKHEAAKWIRLTRIALDAKNREAAEKALSAGLKVDPANKELYLLKKELHGGTSEDKQPEKHYVDPKGYFKLLPPEGWEVEEFPDDPQGKVSFKGPDGVKIFFLAKNIETDASGKPVEKDKLSDEEIAADPNLEKITFAGYPAVKRLIDLSESNMLMIDFVAGQAKHNLFYSAPSDKFNQYLPLAKETFASYEVINKKSSSEDAPVFFMLLIIIGAVVLANQKSIARSTAAPGFASLTTPLIGLGMVAGGFVYLAEADHVILAIFSLFLAAAVAAAPFVLKEKKNRDKIKSLLMCMYIKIIKGINKILKKAK